jgi:hypothetical protein
MSARLVQPRINPEPTESIEQTGDGAEWMFVSELPHLSSDSELLKTGSFSSLRDGPGILRNSRTNRSISPGCRGRFLARGVDVHGDHAIAGFQRGVESRVVGDPKIPPKPNQAGS